MTDTKTAPKTTTAGANADVAAGVAQYFTPVVHELVALVVNGKQAHWHVRGVNAEYIARRSAVCTGGSRTEKLRTGRSGGSDGPPWLGTSSCSRANTGPSTIEK